MIKQRLTIHNSPYLNQYLFDNIAVLKIVFNKIKDIDISEYEEMQDKKDIYDDCYELWADLKKNSTRKKLSLYHLHTFFMNLTDPNYEIGEEVFN